MTNVVFGTSPFAHRRLPVGFFLVVLAGSALLAGCRDGSDAADDSRRTGPPVPVAPATPPEGVSSAVLRERLGANENARFLREGGVITQVELHESGVGNLEPLRALPLKALGISGLAVRDLAPLEGMPLELLTAEETPVDDVSSLAKMPLRELYLRNTQVASLEPLRGCPIEQLNIVGTPVVDLGPVAEMPLHTLWIASTPVNDLAPLSGKSIVSLDLENTPVDDLSIVATLADLRRLNIARTSVTDLTPIAGLKLDRLIFTPSTIDRGIDAVRNMPTLQTLGVDFDHQQPATEFWTAYDAGAFSEGPPPVNPE
jgi:internalin A